MTSENDFERDAQRDPDRRTPPVKAPGVFPRFSDPAFSVVPPESPVQPDAPAFPPPPEDTEFIGHPDFSAKAAENRPPDGEFGLEEWVDEVAGKTGSRKERS